MRGSGVHTVLRRREEKIAKEISTTRQGSPEGEEKCSCCQSIGGRRMGTGSVYHKESPQFERENHKL